MATQLPAVVGQPRPPAGMAIPPKAGPITEAALAANTDVARRHRPLSSLLDHADHPFDTPHSIMKYLKAEIDELKLAIQAEQQQRGHEHKRIGQELAELHKRITEDKADLLAAKGDWNRSLADEVSRLSNALREMDTRLNGKVSLLHDKALSEVGIVRRELSSHTVTSVNRDSALEKSLEALTALIKANSEGDTEFSRDVLRTQSDFGQKLKRQQEELEERLKVTVQLVGKVATLHNSIDGVQMQHSQEHRDLHSLLQTEVSRMEQVIAEFRESTASAIRRHWKTMSDDFAEVRARMTGLNNGLDVERHERSQVADKIHGKIEDHWSQTMKWTPVTNTQPSLYTHRPRT